MGYHYDEDHEDFEHDPPMSRAEALADDDRARMYEGEFTEGQSPE